MVVVLGSGGSAAVALTAVVDKAAAVTTALIFEGALTVGGLTGSAAVTEGALATAIAAEGTVNDLTGMTVTRFWNPVGCTVGGVLVGAS